jgi:hypothetical protein
MVPPASTVTSMAPTVVPPTTAMGPGGFLIVGSMSRTSKQRLKVGNWIGQDRWVAPPLNSKHQWAVEAGELVGTEALCLALSQTHPSDSLSVADFVVEGHSVAPEMDPTGQLA